MATDTKTAPKRKSTPPVGALDTAMEIHVTDDAHRVQAEWYLNVMRLLRKECQADVDELEKSIAILEKKVEEYNVKSYEALL